MTRCKFIGALFVRFRKSGVLLDKQSKQERDRMKRNLFVGVDFIGDEEIRVNTEENQATFA